MSKSLVIDAGHGGTDPGANGFGVLEKDWNLKMSQYQYDRLKELGANVHMTRTTDKTIDSGPRANLIRSKYDYCMSNHFNAFDGKARGVETIHSIYANNHIAEVLCGAIVEVSGLPKRRVFSRQGNDGDYYFMHRLTGTTETIIVEYGFIDNKADHDFYKNDTNFYKVAEEVVKMWCGILGVAYKPKSEPKPAPSKPVTKPPANDWEGHWAEKEIKKVIDAKIMVGMPDGSWQPNKAVTRGELAKVVSELLDRIK